NLWELLGGSVKGKPTLALAVNSLRAALEERLPAVVEHAKTKFPEFYRTWREGTPVVSLAVALMENGRAMRATCDVSLGNSGGLEAPKCLILPPVSENITMNFL